MDKLALSVVTLIVATGGMFYRALIVKQLWRWFVVPSLHAPEISYWIAFGLLLIVGFLKTPRPFPKGSPDVDREFKGVISRLIGDTLDLFVAWLIAGGHHHGA